MDLGTNKKTARLAGVLYLVVVVTGIFSLAYIPSKLIASGDPVLSLEKITAAQMLFRLGIVSSAICYVAFLFLPFVLHHLLAPVGQIAAKAMVVLAVASVPISMLNLQNKYAVLTLIDGSTRLGVDPAQVPSQVMLLIERYDGGILILFVFWGLWLFPFGLLVYRSRFLPRVFGVLLMLGSCGYLVNYVGNTMSDSFGGTLVSDIASKPAALGEIGICLWMLVRGINENAIATRRHDRVDLTD